MSSFLRIRQRRNQISLILKGEEPLDEEGLEYLWPLAVDQKEKEWSKGSRELEPGESDQVHFDFLLGRDVETIIVYSYFRNAKKFGRKEELGWQITNVYDSKKWSKLHAMLALYFAHYNFCRVHGSLRWKQELQITSAA